VSVSATDQRIRSLRPPKPGVDPYKAHGFLVERERRPGGKSDDCLTIFLAGAECPFTCTFCDLWRYTIDGPTPPGALASQIAAVLATVDVSAVHRLKLYNASNFFDSRAVPSADLSRIATLSRSFDAITVESHASTIGQKTLDFARSITPRLEVAVGLETIHPNASARLNKRLDLARFDRAAAFLTGNEIDLRVFVLLGAPHVPAEESLEWTIRTVEYAVGRGASVVSIIPLRGGNGEMERLLALGQFTPPRLSDLEAALDQCNQFPDAVVTADLWDIEKLISCRQCGADRVERLRRMNATGAAEPRVSCSVCGAQ
jgi:radical SAM enzyme (TIGR01210 family)